jgi:translation initiation factor 1 (eIF-1/SUI1)
LPEARPKIVLKFDGSDGPTNEWTCIAWAYLIELEGGLALRNYGHKFVGKSNVTVAEFEGLLHGLKRLQSLKRLRTYLSMGGQDTENVPTILVQGDSETVIDLLMQKDSSKVKTGLKTILLCSAQTAKRNRSLLESRENLKAQKQGM